MALSPARDRPTVDAPPPLPPDPASAIDQEDLDCAVCLPQSHECVGEANDRLVRQVGQRINGMMQGLDRFARKVLGMDGAALLQAWMPVLLDWLQEHDIADVPADEEVASAAEAAITAVWRKVVA